MTEECTVLKIKKSTAYVSLVSRQKCGGCKACAFGRTNRLSIPAVKRVECKAGDNVLVRMPNREVPTTALLIYLVPLAFLVAGFVVGGLIGDIFRVIFAVIFAAVALLPCILIEKKFQKREGYLPEIIQILPPKNAQTDPIQIDQIGKLSAENVEEDSQKNT